MNWLTKLAMLLVCACLATGCSKSSSVAHDDHDGHDHSDHDHGDHDHAKVHEDHDHASHKHGTPEEVKARLAKLSDADRKLAEAQKFCVVDTDHELGCMDVPYKLMVDGRAVFLCCEHCKEKVLKDKAGTLAKLDELLKK